MYQESYHQGEQRKKVFTYHAPHGNQAERYAFIRKVIGQVSEELNAACPESRELSIAQTKLEEAVFWANAAIARNEKLEEGHARQK